MVHSLSMIAMLALVWLLPVIAHAADAGPVVYSPHVYRDTPATNYQYREPNNNKAQSAVRHYYRVQAGDTVGRIARRLKIKKSLLIQRNGLRPPYRIRAGQRLCINATCAKQSIVSKGQYYKVRKGDTIEGIAARLRLKPLLLIERNHLHYPYTLKIGQRLCINAKQSCTQVKKYHHKDYYYVRKGDTVERIARKLHLKQAWIIKRNTLKPPYVLKRGQRLCVSKTHHCNHPKTPPKSVYQYHVRAGDTLGRIAIKHGVSLKKLAQWNGLSSPYTIFVGQELSLHKNSKKKNHQAKSLPPGTVSLPNTEYTVRRYETLDYLSNRFSIAQKQIIALNHLKKPYTLKQGQVLCLNNPAPCRSTVHIVAPKETLALIAQRYKLSIDSLRQLNLLKPPYEVFPSQRICLLKPYPCIGAHRVNKLDKNWMPRLEWPLSNDHRIVTPFGRHGGRMHDGIDIQAIKGTPVYAAADGRVIFAGAKLGKPNPKKKKALKSAYGKMVVIEHPNHIFTIYAHNSTIYARHNRQVKQGDIIALSGDTGRVDMPQLHFELRKGKKAINPLEYLPQRAVIIDYEK